MTTQRVWFLTKRHWGIALFVAVAVVAVAGGVIRDTSTRHRSNNTKAALLRFCQYTEDATIQGNARLTYLRKLGAVTKKFMRTAAEGRIQQAASEIARGQFHSATRDLDLAADYRTFAAEIDSLEPTLVPRPPPPCPS